MRWTNLAKMLAAASLVVLAACGGSSPGDDPAETPDPVPETSSAPEPGSGSTDPVTAPSDDFGLLTDVRVAGHEGYDRVVFEFADDLLPGYTIEYTDLPIIEDGSGREIDLPGAASALRVLFTPASGYDLNSDTPGPSYEGPKTLSASDTNLVVQVVSAGDFEAQLFWAIGLPSDVPFTVTEMRSPARVVIDFATS